jgi:predicted nicotinamide N-methyase
MQRVKEDEPAPGEGNDVKGGKDRRDSRSDEEHETMAVADDNCQQQPQVFVTVRGHPVRFREDWGAGIGGGLWSTGLAMARYLDTNHAFKSFSDLWAEHQQRRHRRILSTNPRGNHGSANDGDAARLSGSVEATSPPPLRVLELGSGNGLLSACWLALAKSIIASSEQDGSGPTTTRSSGTLCQLYVTDTDEHLSLIRSTLAANAHLLGRETSQQVQVLEYEWGKDWPGTDRDHDDVSTPPNSDIESKPRATFDLIFGSDVAYRPELYQPLVASLALLSHRATRTYLGVTMADTRPEFFQQLTSAGFVYRKLDDSLLGPEHRGLTFGIFVVQRHVPWYPHNSG